MFISKSSTIVKQLAVIEEAIDCLFFKTKNALRDGLWLFQYYLGVTLVSL